MSFWTFLDGGISMPQRKTIWQKFEAWVGYKLATRHKNVFIDKSCIISAESKINPRSGIIKIGANTTIAAGAILQGNIEIGNDSSVQANTIIVGNGKAGEESGLIKIGNYVRIASNVMLISANHIFKDPDVPICKQGLELKHITIEDDVWIAGRVNIMAGVTIGKGSVIGAGAVVTHDIPPYSIAVGNPARVIKQRK